MKLTRTAIIGSVFSVGFCFSQNSLAREWYFQPNARFETSYDTNIRLLSDQDKARTNRDAFGFISSGGANFGVRSNNYDVGLNAFGIIRRYISDLNLDNDNVYLTAHSSFNINERNIFNLRGEYSDVTILGSVIDTVATGQQNTARTTLAINPEWIYALSEMTSVKLGYAHADVSYGNTSTLSNIQSGNRRFFDNTRDTSSIELLHQWNDSMKSRANFEALIFDTPDINQTTTNYNFNVGLDYRFSETWTAILGGGIHITDTETNRGGLTLTDQSTGPLFVFKTKKSFETSSLEAGYYRETAARGRGGLSLVDVSYVAYKQQLRNQFRASVKLDYNSVEGLISSSQNNYTFYSTNTSLSWLISPQLDLTASHRYVLRESDTSKSVDSNAFLLRLNYQWDAISTRNF